MYLNGRSDLGRIRTSAATAIIAFEPQKGQLSDVASPRAVNSAAQAEILDELLWEFDPDAYIPHQIVGEDVDEEEAAVLIAPPDVDSPLRPIVINLRDGAVDGAVERVLEVVPADESARGPLRERWKHYQARGFELNKHDM